MVDPIQNLDKIVQPKSVERATPKNVAPTTKPDAVEEGDQVSLGLDSALERVREQTQGLRDDLPGLILSALQNPNDPTAAASPFDAVHQRLTDPLELLLGRAEPQNPLEANLVTGLQDELSRFRTDLLAFKDNLLLRNFFDAQAGSTQTQGAENLLLQLSNTVDSTLNRLLPLL